MSLSNALTSGNFGSWAKSEAGRMSAMSAANGRADMGWLRGVAGKVAPIMTPSGRGCNRGPDSSSISGPYSDPGPARKRTRGRQDHTADHRGADEGRGAPGRPAALRG